MRLLASPAHCSKFQPLKMSSPRAHLCICSCLLRVTVSLQAPMPAQITAHLNAKIRLSSAFTCADTIIRERHHSPPQRCAGAQTHQHMRQIAHGMQRQLVHAQKVTKICLNHCHMLTPHNIAANCTVLAPPPSSSIRMMVLPHRIRAQLLAHKIGKKTTKSRKILPRKRSTPPPHPSPAHLETHWADPSAKS